jgi:hypothetical protein
MAVRITELNADPMPSPYKFAALVGIALALAAMGVGALRDRGTPRSAWPLRAYWSALRSPIGAKLTALAFACGALAPPVSSYGWVWYVAPPTGMIIAARLEAVMPNAIVLPSVAAALAGAGLLFRPLHWLALGMMFAAIPAAVARGAGEMERPIVSSLAWMALFMGAAVGAVL